jgi:hypothetical protein
MLGLENFDGPHVWDSEERSRRMLKKFVQQGRRRVETGGVPSEGTLRISMSRERSWRTFSASCYTRTN